MHGSSLHLLDFFPGQSAPPGVSAQLGSAPPLVPQSRHFLLCGPERSGKTTLIFSLAYSLAARGASVLILGSR